MVNVALKKDRSALQAAVDDAQDECGTAVSAVARKASSVNPFERGELGPDLFRAACRMGLEGVVSKRRDRPYQAGRSKHWVKVKSRKHPAIRRGVAVQANSSDQRTKIQCKVKKPDACCHDRRG